MKKIEIPAGRAKSSWNWSKGRTNPTPGKVRMRQPVRYSIDGKAPAPAKLAHCWHCGNPKGLHPLVGCKHYIP